MGMEQGGYTTDSGGGDQGSYDYGGGGDFNIGMGAGGDEYGPGVDLAPIDWGFDTTQWPTLSEGSDFGGGYLPGLDPSSGFIDLGDGFLYDVNTGGVLDTGLQLDPSINLPFYQGPSVSDIPLGPAPSLSEIAAMEAMETIAIGSESCAERWSPGCAMPLQSMFDPFAQFYQPVFPDLPPPLPPIVTPTFPLVAPPVPQVRQSPTVSSGPIPIAPGLPPACPTGQYHPYPIGHPQQNVCIPFPPAQTGSRSQQQQPPARGASSGGSATSKPPTQQQACPTGYCKHPTTGQCIPIPQGYARHPQTQVCTPVQQQQCPTGYYPDPATRQCKPIPKCVTPGTVFDQRTGRCVPTNQAQAPACPSGQWFNPKTQKCEPIPTCQPGYVFDPNRGLCVLASELSKGGMLDELGKLPWWLWLALGGLFLLSQGEEKKRVTVQHRKST
jgi:hypothetical protein